MKTFIINYGPFKERLLETKNSLKSLGIESDITVVSCWDKEELSDNLLQLENQTEWENRIETISPVLIANMNRFCSESELKLLVKAGPKHNNITDFMRSRSLSPGEISVSLKHYHAISTIAHSNKKYGLIVEDDIRAKEDSKDLYRELLEEIACKKIDYVDIAGGCGLEPYLEETERSEKSNNTVRLSIPRTRTAAGYIISNRLARLIANKFLPIVFPIDWQLQYIFTLAYHYNFYWCKNPVVIHGSEHGMVKSWREEK